jgi:hypothetical protein
MTARCAHLVLAGGGVKTTALAGAYCLLIEQRPIRLGPPASEVDTAGYELPASGHGQRVWNLAPRIADDQHCSPVVQGRRAPIDNIVVGRALLDGVMELHAVDTDAPSTADGNAERREERGTDRRPNMTFLRGRG